MSIQVAVYGRTWLYLYNHDVQPEQHLPGGNWVGRQGSIQR